MQTVEIHLICPWCLSETDHASAMNTDDGPEDGAASICLHCGMPSIIRMKREPWWPALDRPNESELMSILTEPDILFAMLTLARMKAGLE